MSSFRGRAFARSPESIPPVCEGRHELVGDRSAYAGVMDSGLAAARRPGMTGAETLSSAPASAGEGDHAQHGGGGSPVKTFRIIRTRLRQRCHPRPFHRPCGTVPLPRYAGQDKAAARPGMTRYGENNAAHPPPVIAGQDDAHPAPVSPALRGTGKRCQWCRRAMVNRALTSPPLCCFVADAAGGPAIHDVQDDPPI
jgi:hypothetical protein